MKVAINKCFGGFGLSPAATLELWKRGSKNIEATPVDEYWGRPDDGGVLSKSKALADWRAYLAGGDAARASLFLTVFSPDETLVLHGDRREHRDCPILIQVIEEMGERANGRCAQLAIVEIPDGVEYEIEEYDGNEHIAEKHRTWN